MRLRIQFRANRVVTMRATILATVVLLVLQAQAVPAEPPDSWLGAPVMPKLGAEVMAGGQIRHDFAHPTLFHPWLVRLVDGELLMVGQPREPAWVKRSQVLPLKDAAAYYTQLIDSKQHKSDEHKALAYYYRAATWRAKGDFDKVIADCDESIRLFPRYVSVYIRGEAWLTKKNYEQAIADFNEAIRIEPNSSDAYNAAAWIMATCPEERFRDGKKAVEFATTACRMSPQKDPSRIDTLAAAYAEAGDFWAAIQSQKQAIDLSDSIDGGQKRLELYENHKPFRDE
jgi:tetratricopeptide (TPR) repeat protein